LDCACYKGKAKLRQGIALVEKEIEAIEILLSGYREFKLWTRKSIGGRPYELELTKVGVEIADNGFHMEIKVEFSVPKRTEIRQIGVQIRKKMFWKRLSPWISVDPGDTVTITWTLGF